MVLVSCVPAHAGAHETGAPPIYVAPPEVTFLAPTQEHEDVGALGALRMVNRLTSPHPDGAVRLLTVPSPMGDFLVEVETTQNNLCVPACPDRLTIIESPEGLAVVPYEMWVDEMTTGDLLIFEYLGG
jgi:hypothetical protein